MNQQERKEKIELYGCGYDLLVEMLKDIPAGIWKFRPAPGEWSVHEVLIHLADSESNAALLFRRLDRPHRSTQDRIPFADNLVALQRGFVAGFFA